MCRCINGQLRCTDLPSCRDGKSEEKDDDIENDRMRCEACMSMPVSHVCVEHQGRTFPTRCHAMMCANVSEDQIVSGACRDNVRYNCPFNYLHALEENCMRSSSHYEYD